jgi:Matrixin
MQRPNPILAFMALLALLVSGLASSFDLPAAAPERLIRWPTTNIQIALSSSLTAGSPAIKPGSDVSGAVARALASWSRAADVTFVPVASRLQSVSPPAAGDGVSLITIAATGDNLALFSEANTTARTRVFFNSETGDISEADIVLNPYPYAADGTELQFSTDGSPGTYDLESTLAHEIGHLLGLNHSRVIGATMQATQALNGTYGLPATSERSLSEADRAAVASLYRSRETAGSVEGRILNSSDGSLLPAGRAHVWLEDLDSGQVMASGITTAAGRFGLYGVPPGNYRAMIEYLASPPGDSQSLSTLSERRTGLRAKAFRSVEISARVRVASGKPTQLNYVLVPPQNSAPTLIPRFLGLNGELSTAPVSVTPGQRFTLYLSGEGVDQIPGSGIVANSPFLTVDAASLTLQQFNSATPVITIDVTVAANAPAGDFSVRLQLNSGEVAYLVGGITVDPNF